MRKKNRLYYLASPYTHKEIGVAEQRYKHICKVAAKLMKTGLNIYCPIAHSHSISVHSDVVQFDHDFWMKQDLAVFDKCDTLIVCKMDGWKESRGVLEEIEFAKEHGKDTLYVDEEGNFVEED